MTGMPANAARNRTRWPEVAAIRVSLGSRAYLAAYGLLVPAVGLAYALLLPGLLFGSYGLWVLRFLTPAEAAFAGAMAFLLPLVLLLHLYLWRHPECRSSTEGRGAGMSLGAVLISVVPNALCCTPIVPALIAIFVSGATLVSISAPVQYYLGTYAPVLYAASAVAVWGSIRIASRRFEAPRGCRECEIETAPSD